MITQLGKGLNPDKSPEEAVNQYLLSTHKTLVLHYSFSQYYLPGEPCVELLAILLKDDTGLRLLLTDRVNEAEAALTKVGPVLSIDSLIDLSSDMAVPLFQLNAPLLLSPVSIEKPWGREIWYTGIEARGQSEFSDGVYSVPIPWLLSLLASRLLGSGQTVMNLLKILDPIPEPVYGDLYFELHEEKREVYVVTHIDRQCWPEGHGAIRFGFDASVRNEFDDDKAFCRAYLQAVNDYESVRRKIDGIFDQYRQAEGVGLNQPVSASLLKKWKNSLAPELQEKEVILRVAMDRFTHMKDLKEGDVVKVPCLMPHALQHGVRTVEFQTPVYERKILSFGQKVLTQEGWDTQAAVEQMALQTEADPSQVLEVLEQSVGLCREQIVEFDDFMVQRIWLAPEVCWKIPVTASYKLLMVVSGDVALGTGDDSDMILSPEQAVLLPVVEIETFITNCGRGDSTVLLSEPRVIT